MHVEGKVDSGLEGVPLIICIGYWINKPTVYCLYGMGVCLCNIICTSKGNRMLGTTGGHSYIHILE